MGSFLLKNYIVCRTFVVNGLLVKENPLENKRFRGIIWRRRRVTNTLVIPLEDFGISPFLVIRKTNTSRDKLSSRGYFCLAEKEREISV